MPVSLLPMPGQRRPGVTISPWSGDGDTLTPTQRSAAGSRREDLQRVHPLRAKEEGRGTLSCRPDCGPQPAPDWTTVPQRDDVSVGWF